MLDAGVFRRHRVAFFDRQLGAKDVLGTVLCVQAVDPLLDGVGQVFIGHHHVGPHRVPAGFRAQLAAQHRSAGRRLLVGDIGMPEVFSAGLFDVVLRLVRVEIAVQHQQLVRLRMARSQRMGFELAELRGEVLLLHRRDVLVAEEQDLVLQPQRPDFGDGIGIQSSIGKADVAELGADGGRANLDLDRMAARRWPDNRRRHGPGLRSSVLGYAGVVIDSSNLCSCGGGQQCSGRVRSTGLVARLAANPFGWRDNFFANWDGSSAARV